MIEIDFHGQAELLQQIGDNLVGAHPWCWDIVLPPGFGEERFARQLKELLARHERRPLVAVQGAGHANPRIGDFVHALHWQWSESEQPPKRLDRSASLYLDLLLASVRKEGRPVVLVLKRFHKVLDSLSKWVLGKLREEEQDKRLHTVILTHLPLGTLKKRWEAQNHYFSTSDYGDSRHTTVTIAPPDPEEVVRSCGCMEIPDRIAGHIRKLTGGYPGPVSALLEWWFNHGRPGLTPPMQREMLNVARSQLMGFVEWLDPLEDGYFRDHVINLYHAVDEDQAREAFQSHPWKDIVLDEEGLRAEALGAAALAAALQGNADRRTFQSPWYDTMERARRLYERSQYDTALRVLDTIDSGLLKPHDQLLRAHARIMAQFAGGDGDGYLGADTDFRRLRQALRETADTLPTMGLPLSAEDLQKVKTRYSQLEEVAGALASAASVTGRFQNRVADILSGFAGNERRNVRAAALLLLLKAEAGKAQAGDATACQIALPLPEQLLRTWAYWKLGLNYYDAPSAEDPGWLVVEREWPKVHGAVKRPAAGEEFASFYSFAFLALAKWQSLPVDERGPSPEPGFKELQSALSAYEAVRTGHAHGIYASNKRERGNYFQLIERWLSCLLSACPEATTREELLELTERLPLVNPDGTVCW